MVRQAPVICVMAPAIHLGVWSMALMLWLPFVLILSSSAPGNVKEVTLMGVGRIGWQLGCPKLCIASRTPIILGASPLPQ